jgi:glycosyltransferase involved in cell wall biosynthesis
MKDFLVTVAIPTYKRPRQFRRALESVLTQTWPADQIIVGDDGQDDEVREICASYRDPRIVYTPRSSKLRMTENWDFVLRWAKGGLVALLEDDNFWLPDHIANAQRLFSRFPQAGIYHAGHQEAWDKDGHLQIYKECLPPWHERLASDGGLVPVEEIVRDALICGSINSSTVVVCRDILDKVPPFDSRYLMGMDTLMWTRIAMISQCIYGAGYDTVYTYHGRNVSTGEIATRRAGYQARASRRLIISEALAKGIISPAGMEAWLDVLSAREAAGIITMLAHSNTPLELQRVAQTAWRNRPEMRNTTGYLRASKWLGFGILRNVDRIDVLLGCFSRLRSRLLV